MTAQKAPETPDHIEAASSAAPPRPVSSPDPAPARTARRKWSGSLTALLEAGAHTKVVQEHLGHSSYSITADIYGHVAPEQKREAANRLDAALNR